ncbi:hypothetical protein PFISCL1PPCAC_4332, partial [Pristionchus fissidentatus]
LCGSCDLHSAILWHLSTRGAREGYLYHLGNSSLLRCFLYALLRRAVPQICPLQALKRTSANIKSRLNWVNRASVKLTV